ncbi:T9SS type A sorting domain-containing protein [Epilithonimonas vandammei]|uniref:T9SS C-terminal target domain-containing protein n=1 Tax=Epilithonimonas vandammei TaxID=2487072 RepID=A0A3G8Y5L5_9FLAO|nr:T9SS type A sorting domain-containing protein [Epilithonimonas vandammei]AZI40629.1 T9SS C-terminal target domain-containing protein [Epilithonimonas vandammei]
MKKFYSLLAVVAMTATVNAQGSENFNSQTVLTSTYADGTFAGQTSGVTVAYTHSRDEGDYAITGKGLMLRRADEPSSVEFTIPNGVGTFSFKYRKAFTGGSARILSIQVDGVEVATTTAIGATSGADTTVYDFSKAINKAGSVKIKITYPAGTTTGNKQVTIDDVSWTAYVTMAVVDATKAKANLVKNTIVSNELIFGAAAKVSVYNTAGQVVKTAEVAENSRLDVSALPTGTYVVTGLVNGQAVSQKVIKK